MLMRDEWKIHSLSFSVFLSLSFSLSVMEDTVRFRAKRTGGISLPLNQGGEGDG